MGLSTILISLCVSVSPFLFPLITVLFSNIVRKKPELQFRSQTTTCIMFLTTKRIYFKTLFDETQCLREPYEEIRECTPGSASSAHPSPASSIRCVSTYHLARHTSTSQVSSELLPASLSCISIAFFSTNTRLLDQSPPPWQSR